MVKNLKNKLKLIPSVNGVYEMINKKKWNNIYRKIYKFKKKS